MTFSRCTRLAMLVCLTVLGWGGPSAADLSRPDALLYGRISVNGEPVTEGVVSVRSEDAVVGAANIGANDVDPEFYGVAVPMRQVTEGDGAVCTGLTEGSTAQLFLGDQFLGDVVVRSGGLIRFDVSGGQRLCNGGANDGAVCDGDGECPGGFCVLARAICDGGTDDGRVCECIGGTCSDAVACSSNESLGTCEGGGQAGNCCDVASNCGGGGTCAGTQRVCEAGTMKGLPCLRDAQCPGSSCVSTGLVCNGGSSAGVSCVDDGDCPDGTCGVRISTPTPVPSRTPTSTRTGLPTEVASATPSPTPDPSACAGDCDGNGEVAIAELIRLVNIALGRLDISQCTAGDGNQNGEIAINELIRAVNTALNGCDG